VSLATTIGAGALLGTVLAVGVYNVVAPSDAVPASVEVAPTYAPVATPTVTEEAEDCVDPAVLEDDECVVHKPGPTVTLAPAPAPAPATTTHRESGTKGTSDSHEYGDDDSQGEEYGDDSRGEDESEHEGDHEDGDHEDGDHEDDHEDDGDEHDD